MAWKLSKLFNFKTKPLRLNYDSINHEVSYITSHSPLHGLKYEISKTIFPFLQFTATNFCDSDSKSSQYFTTFSSTNSVFQFCFDTNRSYQFKSSFLTGPISSKFHTIVSSKKEVYSQFESVYNSVFYNIGLKLISPTFRASNLIYVINYCQALGKACFGVEIVGMNNEIGISLAARAENNNSICCVGLQRFNLLTLSYYRKIFKFFELAVDYKKSSEYTSYAAGLRLRNYKSYIKINIDQKLKIGFNWDEKLTETLSVNFNCDYDLEDFEYGVGMSFDG